eukprot:TRINITY_DN5449_c0_g1_i1.p1 TRINITY_DN5449_c0_g1~~TRINITY_DN5449_c0_g1_i1.p1  ORF type:complete len:358 (+),score=57.51 TRINITY_DN5449_c0_g1_i1:195-1268(+)
MEQSKKTITLSEISDVPIYNIYIAARTSALLALGVHLGIFDELNKHPLTLKQVAALYEIHERGADAVLVGLHALQLVTATKDKEPAYSLTDMARLYLVKDADCYIGGLIALEWDDFITPKALLKAMKTGEMQAYGGGDVWEAHDVDADKTRMFTKAMHSISIRPAFSLAQKLSTLTATPRKCLLDVGGGSGVYSIAATLHNPSLKALVYEIPAVCPVTQEFFAEYSVTDRCKTQAGNMFKDTYPTHGAFADGEQRIDSILYSQILHDWPRDKCLDLLQKAFDTLPSGGVVFINEKLITDERDGPVANAMVSLDMLFWTLGQQFSAKELFEMLTKVGFTSPQVTPTIGLWSIVSATKP